jgi:lysophospholipase L1-like esterase
MQSRSTSPNRVVHRAAALALAAGLLVTGRAQEAAQTLKFRFGSVQPVPGWTDVPATLRYDDDRGFGFEPGPSPQVVPGSDPAANGCIASDTPFSFSVKVPEGNWLVTARLGSAGAGSETTIKSETRRLMVERIVTRPGELRDVRFVANVHDRRLTPPPPQNAPGGAEVRLTRLDSNTLNWDDKLTIELAGERPAVCTIELANADDLPTVFLAGDSTVTDQPREPGASWGQMLPAFFTPTVAVANYANSGQTMKSFATDLRLDKILSQVKAGDYLIMQFGHNDEKANWPQTYVEPYSTHDAWMKVFLAEARRRGVTPVLVSPMERRTGIDGNTHGEFPASVAATARAEHIAFIDLWAQSKILYKAMGGDVAEAFGDPTHHRNYGAYELARVIAQGLTDNKLPLASHLLERFRSFDPATPDPFASFLVAPSARR